VRPPGSGTKTAKGYWRVRVHLQDEYGRQRVKTFERKSLIDAQAAARLYLAQHGRHIAPPTGTLTELFNLVDSVWSQSGDAHYRSRKLYRGQWEKILGDMEVTEITTPLLTRTLEALAKGKSRSAISKCRDTIKSALAYAVSDLGWIPSNPALEMRSPKATKSTLAYPEITREEYDRVLSLAEGRIKLALRLQGDCGMRPCEAIRVRPEHLFTVKDHWLVKIPRSKTEAGVRPVPVSDDLARMIEEGQDWSDKKDPLDHLRKWWRKHSKTRMYDLRGWRSDEWRRMGVPAQVRTFLLGHTDEDFTQIVYERMTAEDVLSLLTGSGNESGKGNGQQVERG
jgi:integrase